MAETERTFAELQTLLATNAARGVSAQDVRDFMVSALGGYSMLSVQGNAAAQALTATPAKITAFATVGPELGATASPANDNITVGVAGVYRVSFSASIEGNAVAGDLTTQLFVGGVASVGMSGDIDQIVANTLDVTFDGLVTLAAADVLEVRASLTPAGNAVVRHAQLSLKRVG